MARSRKALAVREFDAFVEMATAELLRTGHLLTWDFAKAEDLVQDTFMRVAKHWDRVRAMDHPLAYARRVLVNLVLDGGPRRSRQRDELSLDGDDEQPPDVAAAQALARVEDLDEFRSALSQLPPRQRAVLVLRYWADLPEAEVACVLNCSVGTVKSTASRGAARLASIISQARANDSSLHQEVAPEAGVGGASGILRERTVIC